jgi:hypothetical protein
MLFPYILRAIESHAEQLTDDVIRELKGAPEVAHLSRIGEDQMRARALDLFANLGKWLGSKGDHDIAENYRELGAKRCEDGVPLGDLVFAVFAIKRHLWDFIRRNDAWQSEVELYQEDELFNLVSHFFDVAFYNTVIGHESARAAGRWNTASGR